MPNTVQTVHVIDDDLATRFAIDAILRSVGYDVALYESGIAFLERLSPGLCGCVILDVRLPGIGGLEIQRRLSEAGQSLPVIFLTAHADVEMAVRAMKAGAIEFLTKPFRDQDLLDAISCAMEQSGARAMAHMSRQQFDLIVLDYSMPGMDGYAGLARAVQKAGQTPVALMSGTAPADAPLAVLERGGAGFIPKTMPARSFVNAIRFMAAGETYLPPQGVKAALDGEAHGALGGLLTERERQVLKGLCDSLSNKEIARRLDITEPTVKVHAQSVFRKIGARNRTHAAMIAR